MDFSPDHILAAQRTIAGAADNTPLIPSPYMARLSGHDFLLKLEMTQPTGAFKLRGAMNALGNLPVGTSGVICCSTGNHGRAVAFAAAKRGMRAVICMSSLVPQAKVEGIKALGAEVRICGTSQDQAQVKSRQLAKSDGLVEIPPFDDPHVIAGQGTIALEMLAARPDLHTLLVPLSGGGLAAGVALAAKSVNPHIRVVGITMERGAAMHASLRAGRPVEVEEVPSLADSLGGGVGLDNRLSFRLCQAYLDDVVLVSEEEIRDAMQVLYFEDRIVSEGAGVVGLAAVMAGKITAGGPTGTIITGRNPDMRVFSRIMAGQDVALGTIIVKGKTYGA